MNFFKQSISAMIAAVTICGSCAAVSYTAPQTTVVPTAAAADDCNDDWLHAVGSRLYDKDGNEAWITGVNWFGFNCGERFPHGLWSADVDNLLSAVADRGINTLRLPIATELLLDWMDGVDDSSMISINPKNDDGYKFNPDFCRPDGSCMGSREIFDVILAKCKKYGLKVFIDIHSPALHNSGHNYNLWYYNEGAGSYDSMAVTKAGNGIPVTTDMWRDSLVWLADQYKNDDTLIAYDLKNEPHGKCPEGSAGAKWDGSSDENNWADAATKTALAMLEKNPNAMILVEGVEQQAREGHKWGDPDSRTDPPAYGGWWGGQFRGVRDYPIDLGKYQDKLIYSPHDYGPGVYAQTWFAKDFTEQTLLDDYWYDTWAFINEEEIAPLLIGEWGGFMDGGKNEQWLTLLREYMIKKHINHTFWCLNPNSGDTGGLLDYSFANWDEEKYNLFEPSLWQTLDSGKYIGLDHKTPLGKNGVSLSEYYEKYDSTEGSNIDGGRIGGNKADPKPIETTPAATTVTTTATTTTATTTIEYRPCSICGELLPVTENGYSELGGYTSAGVWMCFNKHPGVGGTTTSATTTKKTETTTTVVTSASTTTSPIETPTEPSSSVIWGDADENGKVEITDAVKIMCFVSNSIVYPMDEKTQEKCDVYNNGDGLNNMDALSIQKFVALILETLPES